MKILWITNILFPEAKNALQNVSDLKSSGGWMLASAEALLHMGDVELHVATTSELVDKLHIYKGKQITYHTIPLGAGNLSYNKDYEKHWKEINEMVKPDIVHIHGTEFTHGLAYVNSCGSSNVIVSIQGLKSVCSRYYTGGISTWDLIRTLTPRDLLKGGVLRERRRFVRTGKFEIELLSKVSHIIGRTSWDKAHSIEINPKVTYHFCNETLRSEFYNSKKWSYEDCIPHSIFLSQGGTPIKGLHKVIEALPLILRAYPDATVRVAGYDITAARDFKSRMMISGFGKYIKKRMAQLGLGGRVTFVGALNAAEMRDEYLRANVFVCSSSIENSPNSLGEAQLLGTPCVSSYVGGTMDMMKGLEDYLYRFDEHEMLADKTCRIFEAKNDYKNIIETAQERHSSVKNAQRLFDIYTTIYSKTE